jgi:hypothetical protein
MAPRYERRNEKLGRNCQPISQASLDKHRPLILSETARKGWQTRKRQLATTGAPTDTPRTHLPAICRPLTFRGGMAMAKPLVIMIAGSVLTWAVVLAIHVLAIHGL